MCSGDPGRGDVVEGACAGRSSGFEKGSDAENGGGVAHVVSGATPHNMFHTAKPAPATARNTAQDTRAREAPDEGTGDARRAGAVNWQVVGVPQGHVSAIASGKLADRLAP